MSGTPQTAVSADHPLWVAWKAYQETNDFKNAERWIQHVVHPHLQGSLWAVFEAGYRAGRNEVKK